MGLRLSRYPLARDYLGRRRELSSRFKQPSGALTDSNLDPRASVLPAIRVDAAIFDRLCPLQSMVPRIVGSWVVGWYPPGTPGQGTQPPRSSFLGVPTRGGSLRLQSKPTNDSETYGAWRHNASALWLIPA